MFRFYEVTHGSICIDGHDIRNMTQKSLRSHVAIVPQDCSLFNDTLGYNIAYGGAYDENFEVDNRNKQEKIKWAAHKAQLEPFVDKLSFGYDTFVGEKGIRLSGGERQRVAIARAILKKPSILCFDRATSSLDTITEKQIQNSLNLISKDRTTIIIAYRLSTIAHADQIIVLKDGRIIENGDHKHLINHKGYYAQLWSEQEKENFMCYKDNN